MFKLKSPDGSDRFALLGVGSVIKSGLVLSQTNAESERSLSINNIIVTKERSQLGEDTVVGLRTVKDVVRFFDPVNNKPEKKNVVTKELRASSVWSSYAVYMAKLEEEKSRKRKQEEAARQKGEESERLEREKEEMVKKKISQ